MSSLPNLSLIGRDEDVEESTSLTASHSPPSIGPIVHLQNPENFLDQPFTPEQLKKNLAVLSISCALSFGVLSSSQITQSSLSPQPNLGVTSFAGVYAGAAVSSLLGPSLVQLLGANATFLAGALSAVVFLASHVHQHALTLAPSALVFGLLLGPWLSARINLLLTIVSKYSYVTDDQNKEKLLQRFLLIFHFALNSGTVIALLVTSLILSPDEDDNNDLYRPSPYFSDSQTHSSRLQCGSSADCLPTGNISRSQRTFTSVKGSISISQPTWLWMVAATVAGAVGGLVLAGVGLDRLKLRVYQDPLERATALVYLRQVGGAFTDPKLLIYLPLVFCAGFQHGLFVADFTKFYVHCALNISHVGWSMLCASIAQTGAGFLVPLLTVHLPRLAIVVATLTFQMGLLVVLWLWKPAADDVAVFYVIAGGWGICKAVWDTTAFPVVTVLFPDVWQAPVSAYNFAHNAGLATALAAHRVICNRIKILILLCAFPFAVLCFSVVESRLQRSRKIRASTALL